MAQVKYKVGDTLLVTGDFENQHHGFDVNTEVRIVRVDLNDPAGIVYDCVHIPTGDMWWVHENDLEEIDNQSIINVKQDITTMKLMKDAVRATALRLCQANNTVTTLEIKTELRKTHPYFHWIQNTKGNLTGVSEYMNELAQEGEFTYNDNGQYRVYSTVTTGKPVVKRGRPSRTSTSTVTTSPKNPTHNVRSISRQKALDMMINNKGHFFTAVFTKKDGTTRKINCQYMKDQKTNAVGYVMVREAQKMKDGVNAVRQINLQTLESIRIGGQNYNIRK